MAPFDELFVGFEKLRAIADLFAEIVDFKSPSTEQHSRRVARLARLLAELHGLPEGDMDLIEVAGLLHDLGKLRVPMASSTSPDHSPAVKAPPWRGTRSRRTRS